MSEAPYSPSELGPVSEDVAEVKFDLRASSELLKAMGHKDRLHILLLLAKGERTVAELEQAMGIRQPAVSQLLQRLRGEGLVIARRTGKSIHYGLDEKAVRPVVELLSAHFGR
jgi:ArsR family transcriptional regulator